MDRMVSQQNFWSSWMTTIVHLFNVIYNTGIIPPEWLFSTFVVITKKANAKECSEHGKISLTSHLLKIFLKIIHNRFYHKLEIDISNKQLVFWKGLGTRKALFALNTLTQRCRDVNQETHTCIIDFEKFKRYSIK